MDEHWIMNFLMERRLRSLLAIMYFISAIWRQGRCCELEEGKYEITIYTCCCNGDKGIYYYTTYDNHQITAVDMHREDLEGTDIISYPLVQGEQILWQN